MRVLTRRPGTAWIVLALVTGCTSKSPTDAPPPVATTMTLSAQAMNLSSFSETQSLTAMVSDQNGTDMPSASVVWASSMPSVASVSASGLVTAIGNGSTTITATSGIATAQATVTVQQVAASIAVSPLSMDLVGLGTAETIGATVLDAGGSVIAGAVLTWSSDDEAVATVSADGMVTAVAGGAATITVETPGALQNVTQAVAISVSPVLVVTTVSLPAGGQNLPYSRTLTATGGDGSYAWSLTSGSGPLPDGVSLAVNGDLAGTPTVIGTFDFTVAVTSGSQTATQALSLLVNATLNLQPADLCSDFSGAAIAAFEDANLESRVRASLGIGASDDLTCDLVSGLTVLGATSAGISSLVGAQNLTSLITAELGLNSITDISPLSGLTGLTTAYLWSNSITDVGPLSGLTNLTTLNIRGNANLTDISPLSGLTSLTFLDLMDDAIIDVSPLGGLTNLTVLRLRANAVIDITALGTLVNLTELLLYENAIIDITALSGLTSLTRLFLGGNAGLTNIQSLLDNTGLGSGDQVTLDGTSVTCADVALLEAKGVTVTSDCP
jgi:Big-like domain-containing protein/Leucine Rich Repeat (LRR) protein